MQQCCLPLFGPKFHPICSRKENKWKRQKKLEIYSQLTHSTWDTNADVCMAKVTIPFLQCYSCSFSVCHEPLFEAMKHLNFTFIFLHVFIFIFSRFIAGITFFQMINMYVYCHQTVSFSLYAISFLMKCSKMGKSERKTFLFCEYNAPK